MDEFEDNVELERLDPVDVSIEDYNDDDDDVDDYIDETDYWS